MRDNRSEIQPYITGRRSSSVKYAEKNKNKIHGERVVFPQKNEIEIEEFVLEEPQPDQVLIKTASTLISAGTELAFLRALPNTSGVYPMYPGYSNAGIVLSTGENVSKVKAGDRVVSRRNHATHVLAAQNAVWRIPDGISFDEAAFFALGTIALQGVRKAKVELGDSVVVLGQGLVGSLALQLAKLSGGLPVIGVDLYDYRLKIASNLGADYVINPSETDLEKEVLEITRGKGASVVFEATGMPEVIPTALRLVGDYGRVIILGSPRGESQVNFYSEVHKKGVVVIGAHESRRPKYESFHGWWTQEDDTNLVLELLRRKRLLVKDLITLKMSFQNAREAYEKLMKSKERIMGIILTYD